MGCYDNINYKFCEQFRPCSQSISQHNVESADLQNIVNLRVIKNLKSSLSIKIMKYYTYSFSYSGLNIFIRSTVFFEQLKKLSKYHVNINSHHPKKYCMWNLKTLLGTLLFSLCTRYLCIKFCENLLTSLAVICETTSETDRTNKCQTLEDKTDHCFAYWITIAFWMVIIILSSVGQHFFTLICLIWRYFLHVKRITK